jgi:hypothetical protein
VVEKGGTIKMITRKKKVVKWYKPKVHSGWTKNATPIARRRKVYASHKKNYLSSGRSMLALSNVSQDLKTSRLARQDANYFFRMHKKTGR